MNQSKANPKINESPAPDGPKLLDRMVEAKQLSPADASILTNQAAKGKPDLLKSEDNVLRWLAGEYHLQFTTLDNIEPDRELLSLFPARVLLKEELLPLTRLNGVVQVATSRLFATQGLDTLKTLTGLKIQPVLAPSEAIRREMKSRLGIGADTIDTLDEDAPLQVVDENADENADLESAAEDASIIKFVNQVFTDAIELRTSDIHLEPFEEEFRIRYRIDGVLQEIPVPAQIKRFQPAIVSRLKILSHLNIAEKRLPQDGRIKLRLANNEVDVRVSIIPMLHGEAVVLRLLRQKGTLMGLAQLGMGDPETASFKRILALPHGIILVTGPTGSGKTTTLYTALHAINDLETKIITIEDPIEYQMKGVNQIQVNEKAGLTFARGLRSILRHDPDVVLVGEIRDEETAQIAVQASLTGHLVFSTLHTNDAPGALNRLVDMHVEPYLVASSLEAVLAQRLVRVLCPHCKVEDDSDINAALKVRLGYPQSQVFYKGVGCGECRHSGFHGRQAIFEWMDMNNEIVELLLKNSSSNIIREAAIRNGMSSLSDDGWRLVRKGITTPEEVMRVTKDQTMYATEKKKKNLVEEKPEVEAIPEIEVKPKMAVASH